MTAPAAALTVRDRTPQVGDVIAKFVRYANLSGEVTTTVRRVTATLCTIEYRTGATYRITIERMARDGWYYKSRADNVPITTPAEEAR